MFSRMVQWSAALVFGATLAVGPAGAVTLSPDTLYTMTQDHAGGGTGNAGTDTYDFTYAFPTVFVSSVLDSTTNVKVSNNSFSTLTLDWIGPLSGSLISGPVTVPIGILQDVVLPLTDGYGLYKLLLTWTVDPNRTGSYTSFLQTPDAVFLEGGLPLPPALLLFGSALVGLGALGRRKRKAAKI